MIRKYSYTFAVKIFHAGEYNTTSA